MSLRAKKPIDSSAAAAADDEIYRRHKDDHPRSLLFDELGNRVKLSANSPPELRHEWMKLYAENGGGVEEGHPDSKPPAQLVQPCGAAPQTDVKACKALLEKLKQEAAAKADDNGDPVKNGSQVNRRIIHQSVCTDLRRRKFVGNVDWRLGPAQLKGAQPAHMPHDNHTVLVDHDRLLPAVLFQGRSDFVDRALANFARVFFEREDFAQRADLDLHAATPRVVELPAALSCAFAWRLRFLGYDGCWASVQESDICATV